MISMLRRSRRFLVVFGLVAVLAIAGAFAWRAFFGENEHYVRALKYVQSADFDAAASELRLCLQDNSEHKKAKGMLGYCVLRSKFDEAVAQDQAEAQLLYGFNRYYTLLNL